MIGQLPEMWCPDRSRCFNLSCGKACVIINISVKLNSLDSLNTNFSNVTGRFERKDSNCGPVIGFPLTFNSLRVDLTKVLFNFSSSFLI